jgi:hypothetical protein
MKDSMCWILPFKGEARGMGLIVHRLDLKPPD